MNPKLRKILSFLDFTNQDFSPGQLTLALWLGVFLGATPTHATLQSLCIILALLFIRVPFKAFLFSFILSFLLSALALDHLYHYLGKWILTLEGLRPFWTTLFHTPVFPLTKFHHTTVMGALLVTLLLGPGLAIGIKCLRGRDG